VDLDGILAPGKVEDHEFIEWRDFYTFSGLTNVKITTRPRGKRWRKPPALISGQVY